MRVGDDTKGMLNIHAHAVRCSGHHHSCANLGSHDRHDLARSIASNSCSSAVGRRRFTCRPFRSLYRSSAAVFAAACCANSSSWILRLLRMNRRACLATRLAAVCSAMRLLRSRSRRCVRAAWMDEARRTSILAEATKWLRKASKSCVWEGGRKRGSERVLEGTERHAHAGSNAYLKLPQRVANRGQRMYQPKGALHPATKVARVDDRHDVLVE